MWAGLGWSKKSFPRAHRGSKPAKTRLGYRESNPELVGDVQCLALRATDVDHYTISDMGRVLVLLRVGGVDRVCQGILTSENLVVFWFHRPGRVWGQQQLSPARAHRLN